MNSPGNERFRSLFCLSVSARFHQVYSSHSSSLAVISIFRTLSLPHLETIFSRDAGNSSSRGATSMQRSPVRLLSLSLSFSSPSDISRGRFSAIKRLSEGRSEATSKAGVDWPPIAKRSGKPRSSQLVHRRRLVGGLKAFLSNFTSVSFALTGLSRARRIRGAYIK